LSEQDLFDNLDNQAKTTSSEGRSSSKSDPTIPSSHRKKNSLNIRDRFPVSPETMSSSNQKSGKGKKNTSEPTPDVSDTTPSVQDVPDVDDVSPPTPVKAPVASTVSSISLTDMKRITDKPALVRSHKNKEIDLWYGVFKGLGHDQLDTIIQISTTDQTYDMTTFIRGIEYQGFNREFYIRHALTIMSVSVFSRFAIIGALRGSNFTKIKDSCENMPSDLVAAHASMNFVKTPKKRTDLTILRNTACIPHWCAYWFIKAGVEKKVQASKCPPSLQFPGAASLPMSKDIRIAHLDFCIAFSKLLPGGTFNMNIYMTAYNNPIPLSAIPVEVTTILGVKSSTESYQISDVDVEKYTEDNSKAVTKR